MHKDSDGNCGILSRVVEHIRSATRARASFLASATVICIIAMVATYYLVTAFQGVCSHGRIIFIGIIVAALVAAIVHGVLSIISGAIRSGVNNRAVSGRIMASELSYTCAGLYKEAFDNSPEIFLVIDQETMRIVDINPNGVIELGYKTRSDLVGNSACGILHRDAGEPCGLCTGSCKLYNKEVASKQTFVIIGGRRVMKMKSRVVRGDNRIMDVSIRSHSFLSMGRETMCVIISDITTFLSNKSALESSLMKLEKEQRVFSLIAANITQFSIWRADLDLRLSYVSPSAKAIFGVDSDILVGKTMYELLPPGAKLKYPPRHKLKGKLSVEDGPRHELLQVTINGSPLRWIKVVSYIEFDGSRPVGYFGYASDATEEAALFMAASALNKTITGIQKDFEECLNQEGGSK